ncbi:Ldh family oxidoreductase [Devosia sp. 2618]|uniref:Ldh family oxidoreductase n=1 Tax=Devosia sp. 2618 TaxID=3156454 RepID=UPI003399B164
MTRYDAGALTAFGATLLARHGMPADRAQSVAEILVEADMMGHDTHGLQLLPAYVDDLISGGMTAAGEPTIVSDRGAVAVWDGEWLSGVWLTLQGMENAATKARTFGIGAVAIGRSHHIGCLQAYLPRLTEQGLMAIITCSDPSIASVAPYGGLDPVFTPDPIAVGIPTENEPILIDMSSSITTNGMTGRLGRSGERTAGLWLQDSNGNATDDPTVLNQTPPGTLLPAGGHDHGHKGYGMALMVEALSQGLSGYGRGIAEKRWGAATFIQVFDPEFFAGVGAYQERTSALVKLCLGSRPHAGMAAVRLPGQKALACKRDALKDGVPLVPSVVDALTKMAIRENLKLSGV